MKKIKTITQMFFLTGLPFFIIGCLLLIFLPNISVVIEGLFYSLSVCGFLFSFIFAPLLWLVNKIEIRRLSKYNNIEYKNYLLNKYNNLMITNTALYMEAINKINDGINPKKIDEWVDRVNTIWNKKLDDYNL